MCAEAICKSLLCNRCIGHVLRLLAINWHELPWQFKTGSHGSNNANAGRIGAECGAQSSTMQGTNATESAKPAG